MKTLIDINNVIRTAAVLYADDSQNVTQKTITRKIVESIFGKFENKELTVDQIIDEIHNDLGLEFSESEIKDLINSKRNPNFEVREDPKTRESYVRLKESRFLLVKEKQRKNSIATHIGIFAKEVYKGNLDESSIVDCFNRFIYELLNTNISAFKKIISSKSSPEEIAIDAKYFNPEERVCINQFLDWNNVEKNKALFDVVSYAIEYSLITNNVGGGHLFSESIKSKQFYLDINVIYRAIGLNGQERQKRILSFLQKCKKSGQTFYVSKFSIEELKSSIKHHISQLQKLPFNKINPRIFSQYAVNTSFYEFYHSWRMKRTSEYKFDLFHAYIMSLYKKFLDEFSVVEDYKIPFNENDRQVEKIIDDYALGIRQFKQSISRESGLTSNGTSIQSSRFDAFNTYLIEKRRGDNSRNITDTKYFFVSVDQKLRNWDFQRNDLQPIALIPSQWMSILLKYFSRSDDDYNSFVSFLHLRQQDPIIQEEDLHYVLAGISEVTEDFKSQKEIFSSMVELQFQKALDGKSDIEKKIESTKFAKKFMEQEISEIKQQFSHEKSEQKTSFLIETLTHKRTLLNEQKESLSSLNIIKNTIDEKVNNRISIAKFKVCTYFVLVWMGTLIFGRVVGWGFFEEWVFYIGFGFTVLGLIYLIVMNEEIDIRKYFDKLRLKFYKNECQKLSFDQNRINFLYENISSLEIDINQLETKFK